VYADLPLLFSGSGLAREGGLPADQFLADMPGQTVGAGLPAMAACQPTNPSQVHAAQTVGAGLLAKTACQPTSPSQAYPAQL
jgi:hypothetical protein